jgi:nicotinamide mononucleotide (NMN) deamidase PncC
MSLKEKNRFLLFSALAPYQLLSLFQEQALTGCLALNMALRKYKLNLVTVESLTAGKIASMLIDVPTFGTNLYGSFVVYDTDAKRFFLGVNTPDVYSELIAKQMAEGALRKSRALVALAVTGNAQPLPAHLDSMGVVDMAVSVRGEDGKSFHTITKRTKFCDLPWLQPLCSLWRRESTLEKTTPLWSSLPREVRSSLPPSYEYFTSPLNEGKVPHYATVQTTSTLSQLVRLATVAEATSWAADTLDDMFRSRQSRYAEAKNLWCTDYDPLYTGCSEPSPIIKQHLPCTLSPSTGCSRECNGPQCLWNEKGTRKAYSPSEVSASVEPVRKETESFLQSLVGATACRCTVKKIKKLNDYKDGGSGRAPGTTY